MPRGMQRAKPAEWSTDAGRAIEDTPEPRSPDPVVDAASKIAADRKGRQAEFSRRAADRVKVRGGQSGPEPERPRKFTALLDADTDARFGRVLADLRNAVGRIATREDGAGHVRAGYDLSRADLLRALLVVAEDDPTVGAAVFEQVRNHYRPDTATS